MDSDAIQFRSNLPRVVWGGVALAVCAGIFSLARDFLGFQLTTGLILSALCFWWVMDRRLRSTVFFFSERSFGYIENGKNCEIFFDDIISANLHGGRYSLRLEVECKDKLEDVPIDPSCYGEWWSVVDDRLKKQLGTKYTTQFGVFGKVTRK